MAGAGDLMFIVKQGHVERTAGRGEVGVADTLVNLLNPLAEVSQGVLPASAGGMLIPQPLTTQRLAFVCDQRLKLFAFLQPGQSEAVVAQEAMHRVHVGIGERVIIPLQRLAMPRQVIEFAFCYRAPKRVFIDVVTVMCHL